MNPICVICGIDETSSDAWRVCENCYSDGGEFLEKHADLYAAAEELLALAHTFKSACDERISILDEIRDELDADTEDIDDQLGHWKVLRRKCKEVIAKSTGGDLPE